MNNGATCGTQQLKRLSVHYFELNHRDICIESISWQQIEQIIKETEGRKKENNKNKKLSS